MLTRLITLVSTFASITRLFCKAKDNKKAAIIGFCVQLCTQIILPASLLMKIRWGLYSSFVQVVYSDHMAI